MSDKIRYILMGISFVVFLVVLICVLRNPILEIDLKFYNYISKYISEPLVSVMKCFTHMGSSVVLSVACLLLIFITKARHVLGYRVVSITLISASANEILKDLVARPRPDIMQLVEVTNYSFPSGHAMNNMAFYAAMILVLFMPKSLGEKDKEFNNSYFSKKTKTIVLVAATLVVLCIGFSRIYLGVHYLSDVIAGFSLGLFIALLLDRPIVKIFHIERNQ